MVKSVASIAFFVAAGVLIFAYTGNGNISLISPKPCSEPLTYRIGSIDSRFDISEEEVKKAFGEATEAWSGVVKKQVARYSEDGEISVHLVYDGRQQFAEGELALRKELSRKEEQIDELEASYKKSNESYQRKLTAHRQRQEDFNRRLETFNKWVKQKNESGGFKEDELPQYKKKQAQIEYLQQQLEKERKELNKLGSMLSLKVDRLNEVIDEKNRLVDEYNRKYTGKKTFIQGTYEVKGNAKTINVFHFLDIRELRLVLAHELGHALGIDHVSDPGAVMYDHTKNQSKISLKLTEADQKAILDVCGMKETTGAEK